MILILKYELADYDCYNDITIPLEYCSIEQAKEDFKSCVERSFKDKGYYGVFSIFNKAFSVSDFCDRDGRVRIPTFITLQQWLNRHDINV